MQYWIDSERNGEQLDACSDKLFTLLLHPLLSVMILVMNSNKYNIVRKTLQKQNIKLYKEKLLLRVKSSRRLLIFLKSKHNSCI